MCGIFGFYLNKKLTKDDISLGRKSFNFLKHRGPDGEGEWFSIDKGIYLAHTRLSIIDLSDKGSQPMKNSGHTMIFNGEIYNFLEIKNELIKESIYFDSNSDAEVLLKGWISRGEKFLEVLDGMYAFAIFDGLNLHLITDPFGEKPLYIATTKDGIFFSSEPKVLIDLLSLKFEPSPEEIMSFLFLGFFPENFTGYTNLTAISAGTIQSFNSGVLKKKRRYWSFKRTSECQNKITKFKNKHLDEISNILIRSLKRRLRADVPIGLFLSSGLDSSLIAALIKIELKENIKTFTVSFKNGVNEGTDAKKIAEFLKLNNVNIDINKKYNQQDICEDLYKLYNIPNDNMSGLFFREISLIAKNYAKVCISGLGGDEAFMGYNKYEYFYKYKSLYSFPEKIKNFLTHNFLLSEKIKKKIDLFSGNKFEKFLKIKSNFLRDYLLDNNLDSSIFLKYFNDNNSLAVQANNFDINETLPSSFASAVDRGSMSASMEVRSPFLSRELFNYTSNFSEIAFFEHGQKSPIRQILSRYFPKDIISNEKKGFIFPLEADSQTKKNNNLKIEIKDDKLQKLLIYLKDSKNQNLILRFNILNNFIKKNI
jgi:asparagine synthase (glutamine-hydrolysing)